MLNRLVHGSLVLAALIVLGATAARGAEDPAPSIQMPPGQPVKVQVSVELVEVSQIIDRDQKFEIEFYVYYCWKDPRFAFDAAQAGTRRKLISADEVWNPDPQLLDELDVTVRGGKVVHAYPDGTLCFSRYYRGMIAGSLDLHEFPLDCHTLEVDLEESVFEADQVVFVPAGVRAMNLERAMPHGWKLTNIASEAKTSTYSKTGERYSLLRLKLEVARDPHYYFWAIVLPLIPIVATAWSVFWMDPKEFSSQVTVGITAMLTIVAYRISIDSSLPPLNYLTRMDYFLLACQIFVFGAFIVAVAIHVLYGLNTPQTRASAMRMSVTCRWMSPVLLLGCSLSLMLLPAHFGHWVLIGTAAAILVWRPPTPSMLRSGWRMLLHPESFIGPEHRSPAHESLADDAELVEPRRRSAA